MASFTIIQFEEHEDKQDLERWLETYAEEVKREKDIWFGENIDKDARARERAVGKLKRALMLGKPARNDVNRDFRHGLVLRRR